MRLVSAFHPLRTLPVFGTFASFMDRTESLAKDFLEFLGHRSLIYEPDGNVPPDFLT